MVPLVCPFDEFHGEDEGDGVEGRLEQDRVVAIRPVDGPPDRDTAPVGGVPAGSFPSEWCFVLESVDRNFR